MKKVCLRLFLLIKNHLLVHYVSCYTKLLEKTSLRKITQKPCEDTKIWYSYAN